MVFKNEKEFEEALVDLLINQKGWDGIIENPTEEDLLQNWANILFENNKEQDRLNNVPLVKGEMNQIIEQINALKTPLNKNIFINGKSVSIKRENKDDLLHFGKEVSLKIYDRMEIAAGSSFYQIARQPQFSKKSSLLSDRRGDVMLLINGMPVIHVELKRSGVPVSKAINQIEKYSHENVFSGIFSLIQVFVAMNPDETLYFANPGEGKFNPDYYFHWADFDNEPINNWKDIADTLLSIPMAHQLIGYYTIPDSTDNVLKVMRSYQYFAANEISDRVAQMNWRGRDARGGYVWHTTGSGKTLTSFKSAQLIASSGDADKVVFLMDRIELGTQSLGEFKGFADNADDVEGTESTTVLITKLKSDLSSDTLIVTSIQKMSNIKEDGAKQSDIEMIQSKRIVFIVDEAHRSTFGEMLITIKKTFPDAVFFGFTGTPIQEENEIKSNTTSTVFGNELHRYSISDGIRDENVLAFDLYKVSTFNDNDIRKKVALWKAKAKVEREAIDDPSKSKIYYKYMDKKQVPMAGYSDPSNNKYVKGIEDFIPDSQFEATHRQKVVEDILNNWITLSRNSKFHAILATSSIREAIEYYRLLKENQIELKVTALFDPNFDNSDDVIFKEEGLVEVLQDYNNQFNQDFTIPKHIHFKKDVALRLAHKTPYTNLKKDKQLDIVIVVNQLLTGFDSKWINTLYLDKVMEFANIIQAFSRTNRLFGKEKPFGMIRYYRLVNTMERNIEDAVRVYSGDKKLGLFVDKLGKNLIKLNQLFDDISAVFSEEGIENFEQLPDDDAAKGKFASLFRSLNDYLEAAQIQGFSWRKIKYVCVIEKGEPKKTIEVKCDEQTYEILLLRYKELLSGGGGGTTDDDDVPFEIDYTIIEKDTGRIDHDYLDSRFDKFLKLTSIKASKLEIENALNDLHKYFASLTEEQQKYANMVIHDLQNGDLVVDSTKTFIDYINEYQANTENDRIHHLAIAFGLDEEALRKLMNLKVTEHNLNEYGRFAKLLASVDKKKAREWLEKKHSTKLKAFEVIQQTDALIRKFVLEGGFDIEI